MVLVCALCGMRDARAQFVTSRLLFHPLVASQFEPRVGVEKALDQNFLTLNIGNSIDLLSWQAGGDSTASIRAGADFFTWSHLRSGSDFRFPVEAIDYLFGVNVTWASNANARDRWEGRARLAHISAHAVDGLYDNYTHRWLRREPFTYSREFVDVLLARAVRWNGIDTRLLAGMTLLLHSIPPDFTAVNPHIAVEAHGDPSSSVIPYVGYDGRLQHISAWRASHVVHAGAKFGPWDATGTQLFVAFESGESFHGEQYELAATHFFLGANIVF